MRYRIDPLVDYEPVLCCQRAAIATSITGPGAMLRRLEHARRILRVMGLAAVGETVVVTGVVTAFLVILTSAVVTTLAVRGVHRRYRAGRSQLALRGLGTSSLDLPAVRAAALATLASPTWWGVQRDRHRMWRAVSSAEHAVSMAWRHGAPVGDLPVLSRQLTAAAGVVDAALRGSARARSLRREATGERRRLEAAAAEIHRAALDSLRMVATANTEPLLSQVRLEVAALTAGIRAAVGQTSKGPAL